MFGNIENKIYICIRNQKQRYNKKDKTQNAMKTTNYIIDAVTDDRDMVLYFQIVRRRDDAILAASENLDYLIGFADGRGYDYTLA